MAVTIRLARHGRKKLPFYRIVAADKAMRRDGRYLELLGTMNPLTNPPTVTLKEDRVQYWVSVGARPSQTAGEIIETKLPGYFQDLEKVRDDKVRKTRAARKARAKSAGGTKATTPDKAGKAAAKKTTKSAKAAEKK